MGVDGAGALAATKLRPPTGPPRLVERPRLTSVLDGADASTVPFLLVSAPAGSGKSTLVASWAAQHAGDVAWLQLEDSDADPARFWVSVAAAIGRVQPAAADRLAPLVMGSQGAADVVVPALVNAVAALPTRLLLVLDDYHLVDDAEVHRGVERLIELCPPQLTVVVATRADPPFRLGRMRVRGRVREIRASDLRFDHDEAARLLGPVADTLDAARLVDLCERTEGWAAGLVLAGLSLERVDDASRFVDTFRGDDQLVAGYLADELLAVLPDDERRRMVEAAVLHRLSGPLLDSVTGSTDGAAWLAELASRNQLLIRLDATGDWYRYHHLFRDLLMMEARRSMPDRLPDLHRRAADWFEANAYPAAAVDHLLLAGERDRAMDLMRIVGPDLLGTGQRRRLRNLLDRIADGGPFDTVCALLSGWDHYLAARYEVAEGLLAQADERMPADFDPMRMMPLRINVALGRGDVAGALRGAREVMALGDLITRPSELAAAVGVAFTWAGLLDEARGALTIALSRTREERRVTAHTLTLVGLALVELQAGVPSAATAAAERAIAAAEEYGLDSYHGIAPAFAVRAAATDRPERARADAEHAARTGRGATTMLGLVFVLTVAGDVLLQQGDASGEELLAEARAVLDRCPDAGVAAVIHQRAAARHGLGGSRLTSSPRLVEQLSERELAVLRYLPSTLSLREIATELYVSLNTVKTHSGAIYRKLGVTTRADAVRVARDLHLL